MVVIGLENVLVLTKSVVSTPVDLEVKLRIAQGNAGSWGGTQGRAYAVLSAVEETGPEIALALTSSVTWCGPPGPGSLLAHALRNHGIAGLYFVLVHVSLRTQTGLCRACVWWPFVQTGTWCCCFLPHSTTLGPDS